MPATATAAAIVAAWLNHFSPYVASDIGPYARDVTCMAENLYAEARGESYEGKIAVAQVVTRRAAERGWREPGSLCRIVHERKPVVQFSWTVNKAGVRRTIEPGEPWDASIELASHATFDHFFGTGLQQQVCPGATFYYSHAMLGAQPAFFSGLVPLCRIGGHTFFREPTPAEKNLAAQVPGTVAELSVAMAQAGAVTRAALVPRPTPAAAAPDFDFVPSGTQMASIDSRDTVRDR